MYFADPIGWRVFDCADVDVVVQQRQRQFAGRYDCPEEDGGPQGRQRLRQEVSEAVPRPGCCAQREPRLSSQPQVARPRAAAPAPMTPWWCDAHS